MSWWDDNVEIEVFKRWVKGVNATSRKFVRGYIFNKGYRIVLDVGAGICEDYYGFLELGGLVHYEAVDFTKKFVEACKITGIHVQLAQVDNLPFPEMIFDVSYCRHVLEHLPYYEDALTEMIRVAKKEVIVTFFLPPHDEDDRMLFGNGLHSNIYNRKKLEEFLMRNQRVYNITWQKIGVDEEIMYIELS